MSERVKCHSSLAEQQAALVAALTSGGESPPGFDASHFHAASVALGQKRARSAAHAWPVLFQSLGDRGWELFAAYAETTPLPRHGGPLADGRFFARWLHTQGELPTVARLEILAVDLRYASRTDGLVARRRPAIKIALLKPMRFVVAVRIPRLGEYWWTS